ncbi:MAG: hypothetical protein U1A72_01705 [Sulfuritalea sp.]|nr:hypothetical protein [Sulfuritalea sp.]
MRSHAPKPPRRADFSRPTTLSALILLSTLPFAIYWAAQRGLADVVAQEPRYQIERWRAGKWAPDQFKLDAMQAELSKARDLDPNNPNLLEDIGRFHAVRVERGRAYDPDVRAQREQALARFRQALEQRPTSAHAYVNVALIKYRLGEIDLEFSESLLQAIRRGPWEPRVQLIGIELGLAAWQALADSTRETLKHAIHAQAQWQLVKQKPALQSLLKRYSRTDLAYLL